MDYFVAFAYLRNRGYSEKELDAMTIPQVISLYEQNATKKLGQRGLYKGEGSEG